MRNQTIRAIDYLANKGCLVTVGPTLGGEVTVTVALGSKILFEVTQNSAAAAIRSAYNKFDLGMLKDGPTS